MDEEQDQIQFLGFFGIFKETFKIISTYRQIFTQITLSIILPLSIIFLAHIQVSEYLFGEIIRNENNLDHTPKNTNKYNSLSHLISSELRYYWLFKVLYFIFFLILYLISTSAIVYSIACIYTSSKHLSFKTVMSVVPKVWKRLMVTFVWSFIVVLAFNLLFLVALFLWAVLIGFTTFGIFILSILVVVSLLILVHITIIWHLASVVSVLEQDYGIQAMLKSQELIKGKRGVSRVIYIVLNICFIGIHEGFEKFVVLGQGNSVMARSIYAVVFFLLLSVLILLSLIVQTIFYFICKSFHHENIDKSLLADHLELYLLGDYMPLKSKNIQLENFDI